MSEINSSSETGARMRSSSNFVSVDIFKSYISDIHASAIPTPDKALDEDGEIKAPPSAAGRVWLGCLEFLSSLGNALAIRFAQDIQRFNDPSAIRQRLWTDASKTACREEAGPAPVRQGCLRTRHRFAAAASTHSPFPP